MVQAILKCIYTGAYHIEGHDKLSFHVSVAMVCDKYQVLECLNSAELAFRTRLEEIDCIQGRCDLAEKYVC